MYWQWQDWKIINHSIRPPQRSHQTTIWLLSSSICYDKFPALHARFHRQLSKTIENLTPSRQSPSPKDTFTILENVEPILDPDLAGADGRYAAVAELGQLSNARPCIASRISTSPPEFERLEIPLLSREATCEMFCWIYEHVNAPTRSTNR